MSVIAAALRELMAAGLSGEDLVQAVERIEAAVPALSDATAEKRRAWDRARKVRNSTRSTGIPPDRVESAGVSPETKGPPDPLKNSTSSHPPSPPKGGSSPIRISPSKAELDAIWEITPRLGRERSSRKDLERSLTAAMRRGHDPTTVKTGIEAAYASPSFSGEHAKGVHRLIENDRWQSFTENIAPKNSSLARIEALAAAGFYGRT